MEDKLTHIRAYDGTRNKLDSLSRISNRSRPKQLKELVDREFKRVAQTHPEIKEQPNG